MLYSRFAPNPRFTRYLAENKILENESLTVVDVGARGGIENHWTNYGKAARFVCFEPDKEECGKLNSSLDSQSNLRFYPVALHKNKGTYTFYQQVSSAAGGLYQRDPKLVNRFPAGELLKVVKTFPIRATNLDSFVKDYNIPNIDFIKTDAEGADFDIIKGAAAQLKKSVLGISCEIHFQPWCVGSQGFSELEQLVRPWGFKLYDINLYRFANKAFPSLDSVTPGGCGVAPYGQIIFGQAVFFRDPVAEMENKKLLLSDWDEIRVLKAASLFEIFHLPDCALELINVAFQRGVIVNSEKINQEKFCDLITSGFLGRTTAYKQHLQKLANIKKRGYLNNFSRFKHYFKKIPGLTKIRNFIKKQIAYRRNNMKLSA